MSSSTYQFPGQAAPGDISGLTVPPIEAKTAPLPTTTSPITKYYHCTVPRSTMIRTDGMQLIFHTDVQIHATNLEESQKYLDKEIVNGVPFLRLATEEEVHAYNMKVNPRATIASELRPEIEQEIREKLEQEIIEKLRNRGINVDNFKLGGIEKAVDLRDRVHTDGATVFAPTSSPSSSFQNAVVGSDKLGGGAAGSASASSKL